MRKIIFLIFIFSYNFINSQVEVESISNNEEVQITIIEDVPIFPGCEEIERSKRIECFNNKITEYISANFRYPHFAQKFKVEGRVYVNFVIDKEGKVIDIKTKGHQLLIDEAERLINLLPEMTPGKQRGKTVKVKYGLPITFRLE